LGEIGELFEDRHMFLLAPRLEFYQSRAKADGASSA